MRLWIAALLAALWIVPAYATESPEGATSTAPLTITDGSANVWTLGDGSGTGNGDWVNKNGGHVTGAYGKFMYYHNHTVYWQQNDNSWHYWDGSAVQSTSDPRGSCPQSADATTVTSTSGSICDASGVSWTLTTGTGLQVTKAGTQQGTADVVLMYYDNPDDRIYQQNSDMDWWYTAASGTVSWIATVDPRTSANCTSTSWCDDFNGTALNANQHMNTAYRWGYAAPYGPDWDGTTNTGEATAINPLYSATTGTAYSNLYTLDGSGDLVLKIDNTPSGCGTTCRGQPYIMGQLIGTTMFGPGHYFEVRAKVTATPGSNFALWLYNDFTATGGHYQEIDLLEAVRAADNSWILTSQTIHHDNNTAEGYTNWGRDPTQWHTYGAYWTPTSICLYIDRVQTYCNAQSVAGYTGNMWLYLSSQTSGTWGGDIPSGATLPGYMTIDYVRVYDYKPF